MIRAAAPTVFALCVLGCALAAGCGAPSEPVARHPIVPAPVTDLTARQSGNSMALRFTLPARSLDRAALAEHPTIEIYRTKLEPGAVPDKKAPWRLAYEIPSEQVDRYLTGEQIEFHDPLVADDVASPAGSSIAYKVRTREVETRESGDSNVVSVRVYPPPEPPQGVTVAVREKAIEISWTAPPVPPNGQAPHSYRVYREEVESPAPDRSSTTNAPVRSPFTQIGAETVESDQPHSSMATVTASDIFPPAAPTGLEVALIPATGQTPAYIELSWAISSEADLAGYYVYRSGDENSPGERVSAEVLPSPAFRDMSVKSGRRYFYRVTALDRAGNESPRSPATAVDVP